MVRTLRFSSSLRTERLAVTLARARAVAQQLGISRVTDITRLDCVGVPVFASIRPNALPGSLCVNAGKGIRPSEAKVGAYMEAIEYAFAEYGRSSLRPTLVAVREIYEGRIRADAILDFCPLMGATIDLNGSIASVEAHDIRTRKKFRIPAELVFLPFPNNVGGNRYFGATSNGLSSGNSILEATVHGLAELIERDITSFQSIKDESVLVTNESLPARVQKICSRLASVGLRLYVRYVESQFELPYFMAVVSDWKSDDPIYVTVGFGCHPSREIALTRATCEAFQSRLSFIHGGRDDLTARYNHFKRWTPTARKAYAEKLVTRVSKNSVSVSFRKIRDYRNVSTNLDAALDHLLNTLTKNGFKHALRVIYTPKDFPLPVVRILVPGLECFNDATVRVGIRLRDYVQNL
ncbi:MAG: YcaO-like family protein [Pyrinomonadaceae bacterium]